jgi:predicted kinase
MPDPPKLVVFAGLPGVGKSTLARGVAARLGAMWLRVDLIEAALLKSGIAQSFETGLAAYVAVQDIAAEHLRLGHDVVIDAVNGVEPARAMWRDLARDGPADRYTILVTCSDPAEHRSRVESRTAPTPPLPAPTWKEVVEREMQSWNEPVLTVDGVDPPEDNIEKILAYCRSAVRRDPPRTGPRPE